MSLYNEIHCQIMHCSHPPSHSHHSGRATQSLSPTITMGQLAKRTFASSLFINCHCHYYSGILNIRRRSKAIAIALDKKYVHPPPPYSDVSWLRAARKHPTHTHPCLHPRRWAGHTHVCQVREGDTRLWREEKKRKFSRCTH
jgi:hypothetical protein